MHESSAKRVSQAQYDSQASAEGKEIGYRQKWDMLQYKTMHVTSFVPTASDTKLQKLSR